MGFSSCASLPVLGAEFLSEFVDPLVAGLPWGRVVDGRHSSMQVCHLSALALAIFHAKGHSRLVAIRTMSSAKRRLEILPPLMFRPRSFQLSSLKVSFIAALKSFGLMVSPCRTPRWISICTWTLSTWIFDVAWK
ncbi:hypothetical protein L596_026444 [Steinernema carpocapsae]|uniref:Uncharacterized protein n=1 Tax=Steinernema carpocapsae TaxID=34508 RepID=A0A4U5M1I2_STECR|nr:hypothetical protein L596_026444 [Steinernema carpocapsae]